ncbi:hypothetical protein KC315_g5152 [Hortaea werneckii]|nr:hypothetical protein KC315_g5152 [Hortaea werneckii]KAI7370535.1 hypothetical protein KC354_g1208 [Hortaea werneckii]KAI7479066.1 hypothetical protein KC357_g4278 [Hortaea werneckii]
MLICSGAWAAATVLTFKTVAADEYTAWASVIFSRGGERTPEVLGHLPTVLTSLGAQQMYQSGSYFRERYITSSLDLMSSDDDDTTLQDLSPESIDPLQLYIAALDDQWTLGSAQAFMQGFYPPYTLNDSIAESLESSQMIANGSYIDYPLGGYQYPRIHAFSSADVEFPYLGGSLSCPAFNKQALDYRDSKDFRETQAESKPMYEAIGEPLLSDTLIEGAWDYYNAYAIYDYINYRNTHNRSTATLLEGPRYNGGASNSSDMDRLRWYADQQQYAQLGSLDAANSFAADTPSWPGDVSGSISTIAGNMLAAKLLGQLQLAIQFRAQMYKLSVLFGDFEPLLSFFALNKLPERNVNFYGLPDFGSTAILELFSWTNGSTGVSFPTSTDDLYVRFWFRNGTQDSNEYDNRVFRQYGLFNRGPSQMDMSWAEFERGMYRILLPSVSDWCLQCGAANVFCSAWNSSLSVASTATMTTTSSSGSSSRLAPAVAGVIGAVVALVVAGLIFTAVMLLGGVRLRRVEKSHRSDLGGFKGSQKLASDRDLTVPKGGAIGATVERSNESPTNAMGHERVGSWEMKQADTAQRMDAEAMQTSRRSSMEDEERVDPFRDPVRPDERV